jgi:hypothetical protein
VDSTDERNTTVRGAAATPVLVADTDCVVAPAAQPRRFDHDGLAPNDLSHALHSGARRFPEGAYPVSADAAWPAPQCTGAGARPRPDPASGHHHRASGEHRRPGDSEALGGGPSAVGGHTSQIITLVERTPRFVQLLRVPRRDTLMVVAALTRHARRLPAGLMQSLTWDRGHEVSEHQRFTVGTKIQV